jgi:hypothetical protein
MDRSLLESSSGLSELMVPRRTTIPGMGTWVKNATTGYNQAFDCYNLHQPMSCDIRIPVFVAFHERRILIKYFAGIHLLGRSAHDGK